MMTRREAIKTVAAATVLSAGGVLRLPAQHIAPATAGGTYELPELPYAYDALEPHIDAETMKIHHSRHHQAYVNGLNQAVQEQPGLQRTPLTEVFERLHSFPMEVRTRLRNHGGGHYNHALFWQTLRKNPGGRPAGELAKAIDRDFGGFDQFKERFSSASMSVFGSGWAWLSIGRERRQLTVETTPNQDNPLMNLVDPAASARARAGARRVSTSVPLLGIDVWEHAYYLKYQNRRAEYVNAFFDVINWDYVGELYGRQMGRLRG